MQRSTSCSPLGWLWLHNVEITRSYISMLMSKLACFSCFFLHPWVGTFSSTNFIFFDDFIQSWFVYIDYFSSRPRILSGSGHFHPQISSFLMISSRVGLFTSIIFHPDPEFWVEVDIFIHKFHLFWWFHSQLVCLHWLFFIQTQNFEWKWTFSSTNFIFFDDFIHSWFVYIDYFSSRPRILSGSGHFHPQISSLLMISLRVGCVCWLFFIQNQHFEWKWKFFIQNFSSLLMISALELKFDNTWKKKTYAWPIRVWLMILEPHK